MIKEGGKDKVKMECPGWRGKKGTYDSRLKLTNSPGPLEKVPDGVVCGAARGQL